MHNKDIFCITVSLISGIQLSKTRNFDYLSDGGFGFHLQFVPIPRIRKDMLEKPILYGSKTYFLGFDPEKLLKISETAKKDLEEEIRSETSRLITMTRKLSADWSETSKVAFQEMKEVKAHGGPPPIITETPEQSPTSSEVTSESTECLNAPVQQKASPPSIPSTTLPSSTKKSKGMLSFSVHLAGARGTNDSNIQASGYYGAVKDIQSGRITEYYGAGDSSTVARAELCALKKVFECYPFPPSSTTQECVISVHTPTEYLANMFNHGLLKRYSINGWKKKDGNQPQNLDILQSIWEKAKLFTVKGVPISAEDVKHAHCIKRAQEEGAKFHQTAYGLIPPGGK